MNLYFSKHIYILILIISLSFIIVNEKKRINFFFFEQNLEKLNYCYNYGIFIYDYPYDIGLNLFNIGDYIQSLAALQYLPKKCKPYFVDRDKIKFYKGPKIKLIMNGWNDINEGNIYASDQIEPIYVSYHLSNEKNLPKDYLVNIKKFSPVGCRDIKTRDNLIKFKINAYFSSCLTTTLDIDYRINEDKRTKEIILIDYRFGDYPEADKFILSLKEYNFSRVTKISHLLNINLTHIQRFKIAKNLLNKYARAKLIITTRLHGALPCLALNTPVIFINKKYDYKRFPGLYEFLNTIGINSKEIFDIKVNINEKGLVYNSKKFLEYSTKLKAKLRKI